MWPLLQTDLLSLPLSIGSGWTPLRQIDLSTNAITIRTDAPGSGFGEVRQNTQIHRSANGTRLLLMESNISSGPLFTYSAATNSFGPSFDTNAFLDIGSASGAVNSSIWRKGVQPEPRN